MCLKIDQDTEIGFCFGVRRAIDIVRKSARRYGTVETLGAIVHNRPVLEKLSLNGIRIAEGIDDIEGNVVVTSAHGISPAKEAELHDRNIGVISTTCPFVHRAQLAAHELAQSGFQVVVYGEADHPEVEGVLGWAEGKAIATLDERFVYENLSFPSRLGILSQTTQVPAHFTDFAKILIGLAFGKDSEFRIIDTICHEIRRRQASAVKVAGKVDMILVIGSRNSANTSRLVRLCSEVTDSYLVETADEIDPAWLKGCHRIGITAGTSTSKEDIDNVVSKLKSLA
jgi:4-hydroxy-3-methylbut-2-enyl diphosphate reductase